MWSMMIVTIRPVSLLGVPLGKEARRKDESKGMDSKCQRLEMLRTRCFWMLQRGLVWRDRELQCSHSILSD